MELNKIAAAILLAGLIGMVTGKVAGVLYGGNSEPAHGHEEVKRGYQIEVTESEEGSAGGAKKEEALASILPLLHTADAAAGESFFAKKCAICHTHEDGGANKTGPNLWGVVNRVHGSHAGFNYSKAMAADGGEWGYDELNSFLYNPKKAVPGTIMAFAGIKKDVERANVIAYLRSLSASPAAIPEAPAPAADIEPSSPEAAPTEPMNIPAGE